MSFIKTAGSFAVTVLLICGCVNTTKQEKEPEVVRADNSETVMLHDTSVQEIPKVTGEHVIATNTVDPDTLLAFARTLQGIPYLYASTDPAKGFDCSGFITYVFNHFGIKVPRSSIDFTNIEKEVAISDARRGDLVLFTGTDSTIREVGHMGIVESTRNDTVYFIHSSSGKANGVTITPLGNYYKGRFVKAIRIFPGGYFRP